MKKALLLFQVVLFVLFGNSALAQYCTPIYSNGCADGHGLVQFDLNSISQEIPCTTPANYYHDFTVASTDLTITGEETVYVEAGHDNTLVSIWIDYNQNEVFDGESELACHIFCVTALESYSATFTVNASALTGPTRLRAMTANYLAYYYFPNNPCSATETDGNCADFSVNLLPGPLPTPPSAMTQMVTQISGYTATLSGMVNAQGALTDVSFQYGLTTSYGSTVVGDPATLSGMVHLGVSAFIDGLALNTEYHYRVVATNAGGTTYGDDMTFQTLTTPYCIPVYTTGCADNHGITNFELNGINEAVPCTGSPSYYHDFTAISTDLHQNADYEAVVTAGFDNTYVTIWIDYNHNNLFDNDESVTNIYCTTAGVAESEFFTVPENLTGTTRLRVMAGYSGYPWEPCSQYETSGNCTDFTVNIQLPVLLQPEVYTDPATNITGTSAILNGNVNPNNATTTVTFEWGLTTDYLGGSLTADQSPLSGFISEPVSVLLPGLAMGTEYHYRVVGDNSQGTSYGDDMTFTTLSTPYCIPVYSVGCEGGYGITQFQLGSINQAIPCEGTPSYYHDYTASSTDLTINTYTPLTVIAAHDYTYVTVWIDFNNNDFFEWNEALAHRFCNTAGLSYETSITLPMEASTGATRLRVMSNYYYDYYNYPWDACSTTEVHGNCSDFTVNILAAPALPSATTELPTDVTTNSAVLHGTVNANGTTTYVHFEYFWNGSGGGAFGPLAGGGSGWAEAVPNPVTGSLDTPVSGDLYDLSPYTTYKYIVVAENEGGTVVGDTMTFITQPAPPVVLLGNVYDITGCDATVFGYVNANNLPTEVIVEYGLDLSFGSSAPATPSPVTGNSDTYVSANLSGLIPCSTYYYKFVAVSAGGTTELNDSFFTLCPTTTQTEFGTVQGGAVNQEIIGIEVENSYGSNPVNLTTLVFNTNGCTSLSDLSAARVFYSGTSNTPDFENQFGSDITSFGTLGDPFSVNGSQTLEFGTNYFWLVYDIDAAAVHNNHIDAECTSVTVAGCDMAPMVMAPEGFRLVNSTKTLQDITISQASTLPVQRSEIDKEILLLDFFVAGTTGSLPLNSIVVTNVGSDMNIASGGVKLYQTNTPVFSTTNPVGTAQSFSSGTVAFNSLAYELPVGHTYFWVTYDISPTATIYQNADAKITINSIDVNGTLYPSTEQSPSGYRQIIMTPKTLPLTESTWATIPPTDWNKVGTRWYSSNTNYAGGSSKELQLNYSGAASGDKMITPPLNTTGLLYLVLRFKYLLDDYSSGCTLRVQSSSDGINWTNEAWFRNSQSNTNWGPYDITTNITNNLSGGITYVAFSIIGNPYYIDNWYIDNVIITEPQPPTVTTAPVTSPTETTASSGGEVTDDAANPVTARGVCWSTEPNPTIESSHTTDGSGLGPFTSNLTGLTAATTYYLKAYATNGIGTSYGAEVPFTTTGENVYNVTGGGAYCSSGGGVTVGLDGSNISFSYQLYKNGVPHGVLVSGTGAPLAWNNMLEGTYTVWAGTSMMNGSAVVTINPLPVPVITGPASICNVPSPGNVYSTQVGMTGYTWTVSAGGTITAGEGTNSITVTWTEMGAQNVSVTYIDGNGCSPASPTVYNVTVYPLPVPNVTGSSLICGIPSASNAYNTDLGMSGYSWTVSAGGTITSGAASRTAYVTWHTTGPQTMSVTYTDSHGCTPATPTVYNINVFPAATAATVTGPTSVCGIPNAGNVYTTESGMSAYTWSINGGTITAGSGTNSITVTWTSTGTGTQRYVRVTYNDANGCSTGYTYYYVNVYAAPVPVITGDVNICDPPSAGHVYSTQAGMTNYTWAVSAGGLITDGGTATDNTVTVTWNSIGSHTVSVTYTDANGCNPATPTVKNVTARALPVPSLTGTTSFCGFPTTSNYYRTESGMNNYVWYVSPGGTINSGGTNYNIYVTWNSAGPHTISVTYTDDYGCVPATPTEKTINVFARPVPIITGPATICGIPNGGNVYTTEPGMTGYTWSITGGSITGGTGTNSITVNWTSTGNKWVKVNYTDGNGCTAVTATQYNVTIYSTPVNPTLTGPQTICEVPSAGNTYTTETGNTAYTWVVSPGGTITSGGTATDNTATITWTTAGAQTVSVNYTDPGGCTPSSPTVLDVDVSEAPSVTIAGDNTTCAGELVTFTATLTNGGTNPTYEWFVNGSPAVSSCGSNITSGLIAYYPFTGSANDATGNGYDGTVTGATLTTDRFGNSNAAYTFNGSGNHIYIPLNINFSAIPQITMLAWVKPSNITPIRTVISHDNGGYDRDLNIDSRGGGSGYSCFKGGGVIGYFPATVGTWDQVAVTYDQTTNSATLYKNTSSLTGTTTFGTGYTYTWIGGNPGSGEYFSGVIDDVRIYNRLLTNEEITTLYNDTHGGETFCYTPADGDVVTCVVTTEASCTANSNVIEMLVSPAPIPTISGPVDLCAGTAGNIYFTEAGMTNYLWTVSAGGMITSGGTLTDDWATITWNTGGAQTVSVSYTNAGGCSALTPTEYPVPVHDAVVPTLTGSENVCTGAAGVVYSTEAGMTDYNWSVPVAATVTAGGTLTDNSVTVTWNTAGTDDLSVNFTDTHGCSMVDPTTKSVTVWDPPVPTITGSSLICGIPAEGIIYSTEAAMTDYVWNISAGGTITAGAGTNTITVNWTTAGAQTVSVSYANPYGCGALIPTVKDVDVFTRPVPVIAGPVEICGAPSAGNVYTTEAGMTGYTWTVTGGGSITAGSGTNSITVNWSSAGAKTVTVTYTDLNGCTPVTPTVLDVTVHPYPVPTITGSTAICGIPANGITYSTEPGMTGYIWTVSAGGTLVSGQNTDAITVNWTMAGTQHVSVSYVDANGCSPTSATTNNVTVEEVPVPTITGPSMVCGIPSAGNVYATETGKSNYIWTVSPGGSITAGLGTSQITVTWTTDGAQSVSVTYSTASGCSAASPVNYPVDVYPFTPSTITGPASICGIPSAGNIYSTVAGMSGYLWTVSSGGTINSGQGTESISVTWASAGSKTITVTYTDANGCSPSPVLTKTTIVYALPVPIITGPTPICGVPSIGNTYTTEVGMSGYAWTVSAGGSITAGSGTNSITVDWNLTGTQHVSVWYTDTHGCEPASATDKTIGVYDVLPASVSIAASANPVCSGTSVTFTATPTNGGSSPDYQWKKNGVNVGWNSSSYSLTPADGDDITCVMTSDYACPSGSPATSNEITMLVNAKPDPPVSLGNVTVCSTNLPGTISVTPQPGSTVDWYNHSSGGTLLQAGNANYLTSTAGTYYAESRDETTGCKSNSRTAVSLTINTATTFYLDFDADGYGNAEVTALACNAPAGYVANALDCDDNDPNINPEDQYLTYSGEVGFVNSVVSPLEGTPYTLFRFEASYHDVTNALPANGYPKVMLDYEGNGSFTDANDRTYTMSQLDALDLNTNDLNGKVYFKEVIGLPYGTNWKTRIVSSDGDACSQTLGPQTAPDVLHESNLYIFANDITFNPVHPDPNTPLAISVVIHNESDYDAEDFVCHLVNQWDPEIDYDDITVDLLPAHQTTTIVFNITTPDVIAWCPMQVTVDYTNVIIENNELDNSAVRPFTNGNYQVAGLIVVESSVSPHSSYNTQYNYLTLYGSAHYEDLAVPLIDPSVAGATVTFEVVETGYTGSTYTNSWGNYSVAFPAPDIAGTYHVEVEVTDFTLTGDDTTHFHILEYVPVLKPNLAISWCHGLEVEPVDPSGNPNGTLVANFSNSGNDVAPGPIRLDFTLTPGGTTTVWHPGNLNAGQQATVTLASPIPVSATTEFTVVIDPLDVIEEWSEADNSETDDMCYDFQPVGLCGGNFWYDHCLNTTTGLYVGLNSYHLYDASSVNVLFEVKRPGMDWEVLGTGTLNNVTKNCYCPYVVSIPQTVTFDQVGTYFFRMTTDPNNVYVECDEGNNVLTVSLDVNVCLPPETRPNLTLNYCHSVDVEPVNPHAEPTVDLIAHVRNNGDATAVGPIEVEFSYDGFGAPMSVVFNGNIAAGATVDFTFANAALPPLETLLTAYVDPDNTVFEWNETDLDNSSTDNMCYDFQPVPHCGTNFWQRTYLVGQSTVLSVGMNVFHLYDADPVKMNFTVSDPDAIVTDLGDAIYNNATRNCYCPWGVVLPGAYPFEKSGTYTFTMTVDPDNDYPECNELNNVLVVTVLVQGGADMRVLSQFINPTPLNPDIDEEVSMIVSYENIGNSNVGDEMKLKVLVDEVELASVFPVPGLATGDHNSVLIPNLWSSSIPGAHVIRAIIDADATIPEINESNNEATRAIIVGEAANLYFQLFSASDHSPEVGDYMHINSRIGNNGDVDATATVKFYYINNDGDSVLLGQSPIAVLAGDSITVTMPWIVADNQTTLVGKIVDVNTLEWNPDDNVATDEIGSFFDVTFTSTVACYKSNNGTLTAIPGGGTAPYSFIWNNGTIGQTVTGYARDYTVTVIDAVGLSVEATGTIEENELVEPVVAGDISVCVNSGTHVYTTESGMSDYNWVVSAGGTVTAGGTSGSNTVTVNWTTAGAQSVSVNYMDSHGCLAPGATVLDVEVFDRPVPTITGSEELCADVSSIYSTEAGMSGYVWSLPLGGTIVSGQGTNTLNAHFDTAGLYAVYVTYNNTAGCPPTTPTVKYVTVHPLPVPILTGPGTVAAGSTGNVYTTEAGKSDYYWIISAGGTITSGGTSSSNTATVTWITPGAQFIRAGYTDGNGCMSASATTKNVTVSEIVPTITGDTTVCAGATGVTYSTEVGMNSYTWTVSAGGTITAGAGTRTITVTWNEVGAQTVSVNYTNGFGVSAPSPTTQDVTVFPLPVPTVIGDNSVCVNSTGNVYTTEAGMSAYSWNVAHGGTITAGGTAASNSVTVTWTTAGAQYLSVIYTNANGCRAATATMYNVAVHALPVVTLTGPTPVCNHSTGNVYTTEAGMSDYVWSIPAGANVTAGGNAGSNSVTITWTTAGSKVIKVNYTNPNGCSAAVAKQLVVQVNATPVPAITGPASVKINTNATYSTTPWQSGYTWSISNNGVINSGQGTRVVSVKWTTLGPHWIALNYTNLQGCTAPTPTVKNVTVTAAKSTPLPTGTVESTEIAQLPATVPEGVMLNLFPNPNSGKFSVHITTEEPGVFDLEVYSMLGVLVFQAKDIEITQQDVRTIDISDLNDGVYNFVLRRDNTLLQRRFVIRK